MRSVPLLLLAQAKIALINSSPRWRALEESTQIGATEWRLVDLSFSHRTVTDHWSPVSSHHYHSTSIEGRDARSSPPPRNSFRENPKAYHHPSLIFRKCGSRQGTQRALRPMCLGHAVKRRRAHKGNWIGRRGRTEGLVIHTIRIRAPTGTLAVLRHKYTAIAQHQECREEPRIGAPVTHPGAAFLRRVPTKSATFKVH